MLILNLRRLTFPRRFQWRSRKWERSGMMWNKTKYPLSSCSRLKGRAVINYHCEQSQKTQNTVNQCQMCQSDSYKTFFVLKCHTFGPDFDSLQLHLRVNPHYYYYYSQTIFLAYYSVRSSATSVNTANSGANAAYWNRVALKKEGKVQRVLMICSHLGYSFSRGNGHPAEVKHDIYMCFGLTG